jgi:hypothetical protein
MSYFPLVPLNGYLECLIFPLRNAGNKVISLSYGGDTRAGQQRERRQQGDLIVIWWDTQAGQQRERRQQGDLTVLWGDTQTGQQGERRQQGDLIVLWGGYTGRTTGGTQATR